MHPIYKSHILKDREQKLENATNDHPALPSIKCASGKYANVLLENISRIYVDENTVLNKVGMKVLILDGIVVCAGICPDKRNDDLTVFDMLGGVVTPAMVLGYSHLGLEEISAEPRTSNGVAIETDLKTGGTRAADGLRTGLDESRILKSAFNAGVLTAVAVPRGDGMLKGQTVAFRTGGSGTSILYVTLN